jgi:ATP-dependent DNA helicase RecG
MNFVPFPKNPTIAKFFIQLGRVDELGSGVINVNRYIQEYAPDGKPSFMEGATFKMVIPLPEFEVEKTDDGVNDVVNEEATKGVKDKLDVVNEGAKANNDAVNDVVNDGVFEGVIEGVIEGVTKGVKDKLAILLSAIAANEGSRLPDYKASTGLPDSSMERYIKLLKDGGLIEFKGDAPKTGGYFLTNKMKEKLKR